MDWIRSNLPITLGFTLSVLLHLFLFLPALGILGRGATASAERVVLREGAGDAESRRAKDEDKRSSARSAENSRKALQERRDRQDPAERRQEEVRLGIDRSSATTLNWIGYEEYERHLAELAEVEQAAYRLAAASGSSGEASTLVPPSPPAPSVAVSPDPSPLPLPAAPRGSESATQGAETSARAAADAAARNAPTFAQPTGAGKTDGPVAPLPPPEMSASPERSSESGRPDEQAPPSDDPDAPAIAPDAAGADEKSNEVDPREQAEPAPTSTVRPAEGVRPAPAPPDPTRTDPRTEPRTDPRTDPLVDPSAAPVSEAPAETPPARDPSTPREAPREEPREAPRERPTEDRPNDPADAADARGPDPAVPAPPLDSDGAGEEASKEEPGELGGGIHGPEPADGASSEPRQPSPAGSAGDTTAKRGELSDRESDATSIIEVPMNAWQLGRPLAAQGIVLRPVRPRFTTLNRLDGIARNPIGELVIGRDGVPTSARIIRSTGNESVDQAIRTALFRWRASGEQLEKLKPGQTLTIRLRLIMLAG